MDWLRVHIWTFYRKSAGPCLPGAIRLRGIVLQSQVISNKYHVSDRSPFWFHSRFQSTFLQQLLLDYLQISFLVIYRSTGQQSGIGNCCTVPPGQGIYHPPGVFSQLWVVLVRPWNSLKFQCLYNNPTNHQIGAPRPSEVIQMRVKQVPEVTQISKKSEKWNLTKTILFIMFLKGWDIRNQRLFQSKIIKLRACNPNMLFGVSNHINCGKVTPTGLPKIIKNRWKSMLGHSRAFLNTPWHPTIVRIVPKWCLKTSKCLQNGVQEQ